MGCRRISVGQRSSSTDVSVGVSMGTIKNGMAKRFSCLKPQRGDSWTGWRNGDLLASHMREAIEGYRNMKRIRPTLRYPLVFVKILRS